jgi:hypothetical protein
VATKRPSNAQLIKKAIEAFGEGIDKKKVTVGDFVRLMELQKEIDANKPRDIKVTWVEPGEKEPSEK